MAEKVSIWAEDAPVADGHYCQAIKMGDMVYLSSQLPIDPKTNDLAGTDIEAQTRQVLKNITCIMQDCGGQLSHVLRMTVFVTDLADLDAYDRVSKEFFYFLPPARTAACVAALPRGAKVSVDAIAEIPKPEPEQHRLL